MWIQDEVAAGHGGQGEGRFPRRARAWGSRGLVGLALGAVLALLGACAEDFGFDDAPESTFTGSGSGSCGSPPGSCPNPGSTQCCTHWEAARAHYNACVSYRNAGNSAAANSAASNYQSQLSNAKSICASLRSFAPGDADVVDGLDVRADHASARQVGALDAEGALPVALESLAGGPDGPLLAVDSVGRAYLVAATRDASGRPRQDLLAFTTGSAAHATLERVEIGLPGDSRHERIRALLVVPLESGAPGAGLAADGLLLIVDGPDDGSGAPWREYRFLEPGLAAGGARVLCRLPSTGGASVALHAALAPDGTLYVLEEGALEPGRTGSVRAWRWGEDGAGYAERGWPVTSAGTVTGPIALGPDGSLYVQPSDPATGAGVLRLDPAGTDRWLERLDVHRADLASAPGRGALAVDSNGQVFVLDATAGSLRRVGGEPAAAGLARIASARPSHELLPVLATGVEGTIYVVTRLRGSGLAMDTVVELSPRH